MNRLLTLFKQDESGATLIEYALIAAFIGLVIILSLQNIGVNLNDIFTQVAAAF
jgi:pilus assembly protein Flp/PilA